MFAPEAERPMEVGFSHLVAHLPNVRIRKDSFNAVTMQLLCQGIQSELFGLAYSPLALQAMSCCGITTNSNGPVPALRVEEMPAKTKLYLAGTVSPTPALLNSVALCVRV